MKRAICVQVYISDCCNKQAASWAYGIEKANCFVPQTEAVLSNGCKGADLAEDKLGPLSLSQAPAVKRSVSARQWEPAQWQRSDEDCCLSPQLFVSNGFK